MRVLELGSYIIPAYAGMILAEQNHKITKVTHGLDPVQRLTDGDLLWQWLNDRKSLIECRLTGDSIRRLIDEHDPDVVIDNIRPASLARFGVDIDSICSTRQSLIWVSMRSDTPHDLDGVSFDVIAQARSWMELASWVPFYIGDTASGLWLAFKTLSMFALGQTGHHVLYQASLMQKLIEGELVIDKTPAENATRWDSDVYRADENGAVVEFKGTMYNEPVRQRDWKLAHLHHRNGRIIV